MPDRPSCFGDSDVYDQTDPECRFKCPARFDCRTVVEKKAGSAYRPQPGSAPARAVGRSEPARQGQAIAFHPQEPKSRRYAAEVIAGMLRAFGLETGRFFDQYRFDYVPRDTTIPCPNCRRRAENTDKFCKGCGYELEIRG